MKTKKRKEYDFLILFDKFISSMKRGKRLQKNGRRISNDSIVNYISVRNLITKFCSEQNIQLRIISATRLNMREIKAEQKYWKNFYLKFTHYLFDNNNFSDNYVGTSIKLLRCFFRYLSQEIGINTDMFYKNFYAFNEEVQIVVLSPERLNYLIYDKAFSDKLNQRMQTIKDIFVLGCTVALRVSDLMRLKPANLERINNDVYLSIQSQKTQTFTRVWLPRYAIEIINKHSTRQSLLPWIATIYLNRDIKILMEKAGWTESFIKIRHQRGEPVTVYRDPVKRTHFRFCDMVTTHTMRRTAITTMLSLGMNEQAVRKISGHAPNSKEFYRYVSYAQAYLDKELNVMHQKLKEKHLQVF